MEEKIAEGVEVDKTSHLATESSTLHARADHLKERVIDLGFAILYETVEFSPRYSQTFDAAGTCILDEGTKLALADIILAGVEPQVVLTYGAEVYRFIHWLSAVGLRFTEVTDLRVAGYIRNSLSRGKTVPTRLRSALMFFQRVADVKLGAEKVELLKMMQSSAGPSNVSGPEPAPLIPPNVVLLLEHGCSHASTGVLKLFCGLACLLTFGVKRWSDAQRLEKLELLADAIVVKSWKSKKKKTAITWGALRLGLSKADWAAPFFESLQEFGFPGKDYLITSPKVNMMGFTQTPARWADAQRGIHAALIDVGVPVDEAITYTLHSFKHLFVTAGRQLQIPEPAIDVMVGWTVKGASGMASIYDSVQASSELLYKDFIHKNFQLGWSLSMSGSIPSPPLVPFVQSSVQKPVVASLTPPKPKSSTRGVDLQRTRVAESPLDSTVIQVVKGNVGCVHLYLHRRDLFRWKEPVTVCGRWKCGSPDAPAAGVEFSKCSSQWTDDNCCFAFCERCYGDCYPEERCLLPVEAPKDNQPESESSSSSESES